LLLTGTWTIAVPSRIPYMSWTWKKTTVVIRLEHDGRIPRAVVSRTLYKTTASPKGSFTLYDIVRDSRSSVEYSLSLNPQPSIQSAKCKFGGCQSALIDQRVSNDERSHSYLDNGAKGSSLSLFLFLRKNYRRVVRLHGTVSADRVPVRAPECNWGLRAALDISGL